MKKISKTFIAFLGLTSAGLLYAAENKATVDLQIDSEFMSKNIIFVADNASSESLGVHHAGGSLMLHSNVDPISQYGEYYPVKIRAFITDPKANTTSVFYSKDSYILKPGAHIALNFPMMFSN